MSFDRIPADEESLFRDCLLNEPILEPGTDPDAGGYLLSSIAPGDFATSVLPGPETAMATPARSDNASSLVARMPGRPGGGSEAYELRNFILSVLDEKGQKSVLFPEEIEIHHSIAPEKTLKAVRFYVMRHKDHVDFLMDVVKTMPTLLDLAAPLEAIIAQIEKSISSLIPEGATLFETDICTGMQNFTSLRKACFSDSLGAYQTFVSQKGDSNSITKASAFFPADTRYIQARRP